MGKTEEIEELLNEKVLVLDGAMGSLIQGYRLTEADFRGNRFAGHVVNLKGNNDVLSITQPQVIAEIHRLYLEAGADIIETNTFNATSFGQADYGTQDMVYEINLKAAQIARKVCEEFTERNPGKPRYVAGSAGPTNKMLSLMTDERNANGKKVTFTDMAEAYAEQFGGLIDGGVDLILIETIFDGLNAKAAVFGLEQVMAEKNVRILLIISMTINSNEGRILSGQTLEGVIATLKHAKPLAFGMNCSFGAKQMLPFAEQLASETSAFVCIYPNAGLPNKFGNYDELPDTMARNVQYLLDKQLVNIIGGCCGTTPAHIKAIAEIAGKAVPRKPLPEKKTLIVAGLEPLEISKEKNFINIGERTNVTGSKKFANLIRDKKYEEAISVARQQVDAGAQVIDINFDDSMLDAKHEMAVFLSMISSDFDIARVPFMIDSSKWEVLETGMQNVQGKPIINSISLKEGEKAFIEKALLIKRYGAAMVVMAFDEEGQAVTFERKTAICKRAYEILTKKLDFAAEDIIFDPNVLTIATGIDEHNNFAVDFIETVRWIKANLPYAKTSGGISNLSFSFRGNNLIREAMHSVFLYHAIHAGLDMAIVNAGNLPVYVDIPGDLLQAVEDVILNRRADASDRLVEVSKRYSKNEAETNTTETWRNYNVEERIKYALIKGISEYIDGDINLAYTELGKAIKVIEGPLMAGMNEVGELFSTGKMFLPQVIKSARVMNKAVTCLRPFLEKEKEVGKSSSSGKILLATVKGDVHDIGKNIVKVVLACNNYEVIDLGVMVPTEKIIESALAEQPDIIGLSGLITPSLDEMIHIATALNEAGIQTPLLIGGAATSEEHTAIRIKPNYPGIVVHVGDASQSVTVVSKLMNNLSRAVFAKEIDERYKSIADKFEREEKQYIRIAEARVNRVSFDNYRPIPPQETGIRIVEDITVASLIPLINWTAFFHAWGIPGRYPDIFNHPIKGKEAKQLYDDALKLLSENGKSSFIHPKAIAGIFSCELSGDDLKIFEEGQEIARFYFLRNQEKQGEGIPNLCLTDFLAKKDFIGFFAATSGYDSEKSVMMNDDYEKLLLQIVSDRVVEALSEYLHYQIRTSWWGYNPDEVFDPELILKGHFHGIRPAIGYSSCPDHSEKKTLFVLLKAEKNLGIALTENYALKPASSVCGFYLANPDARYFSAGKIQEDQLRDYCERKKCEIQIIEKFLSTQN